MTNVAKTIVLFAYLLALSSCVSSWRQLPSVLPEISGAVADSSGGYYAINDGGNAAMVYHLQPNKSVVAQPTPFANRDWEALTSTSKGLCICDIGDNRLQRSSIALHTLGAQSRQVHYPRQPHNAEACYTHKDKLYVLTKAAAGLSPRPKITYLYELNDTDTLLLRDSLAIIGRVVTDAVMLADGRLALVGYNYGKILFLPYGRTSVFTVELAPDGSFRQNTLAEAHVRTLLTPAQYEAIWPSEFPNKVWIGSERLWWTPPRKRLVKLPRSR